MCKIIWIVPLLRCISSASCLSLFVDWRGLAQVPDQQFLQCTRKKDSHFVWSSSPTCKLLPALQHIFAIHCRQHFVNLATFFPSLTTNFTFNCYLIFCNTDISPHTSSHSISQYNAVHTNHICLLWNIHCRLTHQGCQVIMRKIHVHVWKAIRRRLKIRR